MRVDTVTKAYVKEADVFADIFNYYIYGGRQVIQPEELSERDSTKIALPYGEDGAAIPVQKFRDVQKLYAAMTDGKMEYVLYGVENQSKVHYAMAVKNQLYDALEYAGQVEEAARSHRRERERRKAARMAEKVRRAAGGTGKEVRTARKIRGKEIEAARKTTEKETEAARKTTEKEIEAAGKTGGELLQKDIKKVSKGGEFLSGFWKKDKLIPSVTLTIFFSSEEWDGPLSLFDMMDVPNKDVFACMDDYHVRLIAPAQMEDAEIMKFQSGLREVLFFIKYAKDKENLLRVLQWNETRFRKLERRAAEVIDAVTNLGIEYEEKEEKVDMCQAIQEIKLESERVGQLRGELIGQERGELIGQQRGERIGQERGELIGQEREKSETANRLYRIGMPLEIIIQAVEDTPEKVKEWIGLKK